jgi:hypothetical protein
MNLRALSRPRPGPMSALVATLVATAAMVTLSSTQEAHAEAGRRICKYTWMQGVGNPEGRTVSFVADYKKDGACPYVDLRKVRMPAELGSWMPPPDTWEHQPTPKLTCEEFQAALALPSGGDGGDPCTYMEDDKLYGVVSPLPTDMAWTTRFWGLDSIWNLG